MSKIIVFTGGARSGKSTQAEQYINASKSEKITYIATAKNTDKEMSKRIRIHKERRPHTWMTIEAYKDLDNILRLNAFNSEIYLLDCLTNMISNVMFEYSGYDNEKKYNTEDVEYAIKREVNKLIQFTRKHNKTLVVVTNEVGDSIVPIYPLSRLFRDIAGRINQYIVEQSDASYLVICGRVIQLKPSSECFSWQKDFS